MVEFVKERYGADVATILENQEKALEVVRHRDGTFTLTVHNRMHDSDQWEDLSVTLKPTHFIVLGKIANMALCAEDGCPQRGKVRSYTCGCHPRFGD